MLSRASVGRRQLLDPELGRLEARDARAVQLLAASEERDRVVDGDVSTLQARDDILELLLQLLERTLAPLARGTRSRRSRPDVLDAGAEPSRRELDLEPIAGRDRRSHA